MRVANAPSRNFFLGKSEFINLALPFLFLALFLIERSYSLSFGATFIERIIVDIFLLDITHNAFTYYMLINVPELKKWKIKIAGSESFFWIKLIAILFVLFCIFFSLMFLMRSDKNASLAFYLILIFFPMHHAIYQSFGISLAMNRKIYLFKKVEFLEKIERLAVHLFFIFILLIVVLFVSQNFFMILQNETLVYMRDKISLIPFIIFLFIVLISFCYPVNGVGKKLIFSARYLIWALSMSSPISIIGTRVIHAFEYLFVTQKITSNSVGARSIKIAWIIILFISCLGISRSWFFHAKGSPEAFGPNLIIEILASISLSITFSHYFLDRILFRMRNKINRDTVGRLLIGS